MKRITSRQRRDVIERAKGFCEYCLSDMSISAGPFAVDHIAPQSKGGETELDNLALSCQGCNGIKYNKTQGYDPVSEQLAPLFNPRQQAWKDHFAWSQDFTLIKGLTPTGRVTVTELKLNRASVVNLRRMLYSVGKHPSS